MVIYSLRKVKGMSFPKFKIEYKKRLERLKVEKYMIDHVCGYKDLTTLSLKTFRNSGESLDWLICREVLNEMLKELGFSITLGHPTWYKNDYLERIQEVEKNEKQLKK